MPTLLELATQLVGEVPGLSRLFAQKYINKALLEVRRDRLWSWNVSEGIQVTPASVATGTVSVTQFSQTITFDASAIAVLDPLALANPPLIKRQFRTGGNGPIYNITSYTPGTGVATLDRIYGEQTAVGMTYAIYRCYYDPPSPDGITQSNDFLRYLSILNTTQGYSVSGPRLYMTREQLNRRDPLRGALGQPYYVATYRPSPIGTIGSGASSPTSGQMMYEFWPHPTFQMNLLCNYERQHVDLAPNDYLPAQCPDTLVTYKAMEFAYRWALQNMGRIPELRGTDWRFALQEVKGKYALELVTAKRNDNEIMTTILRPGNASMYNFQGPIDSAYYQSHGYASLEG